jgi:hypothetical protein
VAVCRAEWLVDVKTMADRIITMRHKLQQGLAKEGAACQISFSADYCLKVHLHNFSKIKSQKEVTKQYWVGIKVFITIFVW